MSLQPDKSRFNYGQFVDLVACELIAVGLLVLAFTAHVALIWLSIPCVLLAVPFSIRFVVLYRQESKRSKARERARALAKIGARHGYVTAPNNPAVPNNE